MKKVLLTIVMSLISVTLLNAQQDLSKVEKLRRTAVEQHEAGNLKKACKTMTKALVECKKVTGKLDTTYVDLLIKKGEFFLDISSNDFTYTNQAYQTFIQAHSILKSMGDTISFRYIDVLGDIAVVLYNMGDTSAYTYISTALRISEQHLGTNTCNYADALFVAGAISLDCHNYKEGVHFLKRAIYTLEQLNAIDSSTSTYKNSLMFLIVAYEKMNELDSLQIYYEKCSNYTTQHLYDKDTRLLQFTSKYASILLEEGRFDEAKQLRTIVKSLLQDTIGTYNKTYLELSLKWSVVCMNYGYFNDAIEELIAANTICSSIKKDNDLFSLRIHIMNVLSRAYLLSGNYPQALYYAEESIKLNDKNIDALYCMSVLHGFRGEYDRALSEINMALVLCDSTNIEHFHSIIDIMEAKTEIYKLDARYLEAIKSGKQVIETAERTFSKRSIEYAKALFSLSRTYRELGDYYSAISILEEVLDIYRETSGIHSCMGIMAKLCEYYRLSCQYDKALEMAIELNTNTKIFLDEANDDYFFALYQLVRTYISIGDYAHALILGEELERISQLYHNDRQINRRIAIGVMSECYSLMGNIKEYILYKKKEIDVIQKTNNDYIHIPVIEKKEELSELYKKLKQYEKADSLNIQIYIERQREANRYAKQLNLYGFSIDTLQVSTDTNTMSEYYNYMTRVGFILADTILKMYNSNLLSTEQKFNFEKTLLAEVSEIVATYYFFQCKHVEAIALYKKILSEISNKHNISYTNMLGHLEEIYWDIDDYENAMNTVEERFRLTSEFKNDNTDYYFDCLDDLITAGLKTHQYDSVDVWCTLMSRKLKKNIVSQFMYISSNERTQFWNKREGWFHNRLPHIVMEHPSTSLVQCGINATLLSKGILLTSDIELRRLIKESSDTSLLSKYESLVLTRLMIDRLYEMPIDKRPVSIESLNKNVIALERELAVKSKKYGDFMAFLNIQWTDVQKKLFEKEAAVEFSSFKSGDTTIYAAYVIRHNTRVPNYVVLYKDTVEPYYGTGKREQQALSKILWGELAPYLKGVKTVYFAPTGELYNIPIEYLPDYADSTRLIGDRWNLYRLSSTRELALHKDRFGVTTGAVYGGLRYDMDSTQLHRDSKRHSRQLQRTWDANATLSFRNGVSDLPGTRIEALTIDSLLRSAHITDTLYTDTLGTEASFKALSGQQVGMMFVATHGFYWMPDMVKSTDLSFLLGSDLEGERYVEDKALTRSGLVMAGANATLRDTASLPQDVDDGILTAKEIAQLDLLGLDMLVLSACQTGLGDISGDGVFGLQRGFKKAGVNSILMSLWEVDDWATKELVTQFCQNWLVKKMTKQQALKAAQEYVRNFEMTVREWGIYKATGNVPRGVGGGHSQARGGSNRERLMNMKDRTIRPFQSPEYWAGFILLDGLD